MADHASSGVTLLELLLAVSLLSLLSVGIMTALRVGVTAMEKANVRLMDNRRMAGVQRILEQQIAGFVPVMADCVPEARETSGADALLSGRAPVDAPGVLLLIGRGLAGIRPGARVPGDPRRKGRRRAFDRERTPVFGPGRSRSLLPGHDARRTTWIAGAAVPAHRRDAAVVCAGGPAGFLPVLLSRNHAGLPIANAGCSAGSSPAGPARCASRWPPWRPTPCGSSL